MTCAFSVCISQFRTGQFSERQYSQTKQSFKTNPLNNQQQWINGNIGSSEHRLIRSPRWNPVSLPRPSEAILGAGTCRYFQVPSVLGVPKWIVLYLKNRYTSTSVSQPFVDMIYSAMYIGHLSKLHWRLLKKDTYKFGMKVQQFRQVEQQQEMKHQRKWSHDSCHTRITFVHFCNIFRHCPQEALKTWAQYILAQYGPLQSLRICRLGQRRSGIWDDVK